MGLGLHGGGVGTVKFLVGRGARVIVTDLRTRAVLKPSLEQFKGLSGITYVLGKHRESDFLKSDLIVKNPGVPPTSPYLALARKHKIPVTTDIGIFFRECPGTIIGITGTRGKSTTAWLIWKFLKTRYTRVFLGGNIRKSVFDFLAQLKSDDLIVLELSSFQLQDIALDKISPPIAVVTNIMRDHLNWHATWQSYIKAKSVIFAYQGKDEMLFANKSDVIVKKMAAHTRSQVVFPRLPGNMQMVVDKNLGVHYRSSVALAIGVCRHLGVSDASIRSVLKNFHGLPGRQELVATIKGVRYINDTTATIPDASIAAIKRFRILAKKARLILIAGGSDKKLIFSEMAEVIGRNVDCLILLPGTATERLRAELAKKKKSTSRVSVQEAASMAQAVSMAYALSTKGDYVLLSPGAASFGLFVNEFDRGDQFVAAVKNLQNKK